MQDVAYSMVRESEGTWWYRGRALIASRVLRRFLLNDAPGRRILDVGAGFGSMFTTLSRFGEVSALEPDPDARETCRVRGYAKVLDANNVFELSEKDGTFSLVSTFDVLEHIEDDVAALRSIKPVLGPGGYVIATVPAYQFLWSKMDDINNHFRRYRAHTLSQVFAQAGYEVRYVGYWNMFMFLPAALMRLSGRTGESSLHFPKILDQVLYVILMIESCLIPFISLPFGMSIVLLASPKDIPPRG